MTKRIRQNHTLAFKAKMALAAIKGEKMSVGLAQQFDVHPSQITVWKGHLLEAASGLFDPGRRASKLVAVIDIKTLHTKIGS